MMKAVIVAGGKGKRLGEISNAIPKPMFKINGKPILQYQVELLKKYGFTEIIMCVAHLAGIIKDYFKDGKEFGVSINYFTEEAPLGTAGCVKEIENELDSDFLVLYGDVMVNMDFHKLAEYHKKHRPIGTLVVHPNDHPFDSDLVKINEENKIIRFLNKPHPENLMYKNLVSAALYVLSPKIFKYIEKGKKADFAKDIFPKVLADETTNEILYAYNTPEYLKDAGTPERISEIEHDINSGKFSIMNSEHKRPAVFLDRDGVINKEVDELCRAEDFELLPNTSNAIKKINSSKYLAVIITNQPMIAKGKLSFGELEKIHNKMETLLGNQGAKIDAVYFCPHHPEKGFENEVKELKIECSCRKPKTGMIDEAAKKLNIDLKNSFIVGDSYRDILCGKNAGIKSIGVETGYGCRDCNDKPIQPDYIFSDLEKASDFIVKHSI